MYRSPIIIVPPEESDEDLTKDQIVEGLTRLTEECLADKPDY